MATDLRDTALNPNMPMRRDQLAQMTATPRSPRLGFLADAMMALKEFANRVQVPADVPLLGGEGVGSLLLGKAPEELVEMSYGNMPMRINPYAGQTASFVPEMKPGRGAQVADLLSLAPTPSGARAAAGLAGMADLGGMERALIGYHGTPARFAAEEGAPLGRFRAEKIGSGEGAQAYGYGLYFAEAPGVAKGYQTTLSPRNFASIVEKGRNSFDVVSPSGEVIASNVLRGPAQKAKDAFDAKQTGSFYTVDIPDEMIGKMLDWDKPLSEQSDAVKKAIGLDKNPNASIKDMTGAEFYVGTGAKLGSPTSGSKEAAAHLSKKGIVGIRYLDQGSRAAGDGTRNIVVFPGEESKIKILSRE